MFQSRRLVAVAAAIWGLFVPPATTGQARAETTLRMVSHADIKVLDPIWTTALITRNFGYMIYDVLFAKDADLNVQPQMAEGYKVSEDKLTYTITLRDGLKWSDGTPVTSEDCIASIKRWGAREAYGQLLLKSTAELKKVDDRSFAIVLKEPFGFVLDSLAKDGSYAAFVMREQEAKTDPNAAITEVIGRPVRHCRLSVEALADRYRSFGLPGDYADLLAGMDGAIARGSEDRSTTTVEDVTGRPPTSLATFLAENRKSFTSKPS